MLKYGYQILGGYMLGLNIDKSKFVEAVRDGLMRTQEEIYASGTLTSNRVHMQKWDYIATSLKNYFSSDARFIFIPLDRGLFKPVMIFDVESKTLYTIMKEQNFNNLTDRKSVVKSHYIDALLDYNYGYQTEPLQIDIFDYPNLFSTNAKHQINDLKIKIESLLKVDDINKYITIVVDFTGFALSDVKAVLCSKWLNIIASESWADYITPSYEEIEVLSEEEEYVQESNIKDKISIGSKIKREHA